MTAVSKELLAEIKNDIDITWEDAAGDEKLSGCILRGMNRINDLCGTQFDYSPKTGDSQAKDLLLNYVIYARAGALDDFMKNYQADINALQIAQEVKRYAQQQAEESGTV